MAQAPGQYGNLGGLFSFGGTEDPSVNPAYLQLPQAQGQAPIPYSPEGWQAGKMMAPVEPAQVEQQKAEQGKGKKPVVGFTPEQAMALQRLTGMGAADGAPRGGGGGGVAPRGQVGQMQQLNAGGPTAPRASLGQIIYGGRKF